MHRQVEKSRKGLPPADAGMSNRKLEDYEGVGHPPSAVENTLETGQASAGNAAGTTVTYDPVNNISVVTNSSGKVITVRYGAP
jgi:filamentous hemagglutinin